MEMEEAKMDMLTNYGRHVTQRSEARARYSKVAGRQTTARRDNRKKSPMFFKERLIFQAIICGGFLAILLFFNIVDSNFTNGVTGWIDRNISYNMLMGIFGDDDTDYIETFQEVPPAPIQTDSSRVDENILHQINSAVDVYYENNR